MTSFYISPTGTGAGASIDDPASMAALPYAVSGIGAGGNIYLIADQGSYDVPAPIIVTGGGAVGAPVTISGIASDGSPMKAEIVGIRDPNWVAGGQTGTEIFRLIGGADNLTFENLTFRNIGNGAIRAGDDISNLVIQHIDAINVQRFFEDNVSGLRTSASIHGLTIRDINIDGFSKGAIRVRYDSSNVLIEDVTGDSQFQDGDNFAIGVHLDGTAHDILINRVVMRNALDTLNADYPNGDGFATERTVYNLTIKNSVATGNRDGGFDIKSTSTTLIRTIAEGNAHNYRLWNTDSIVTDAISLTPGVVQGQDASLYNFGFSIGAKVQVINPHVVDLQGNDLVFHTDTKVKSTITGADFLISPTTILKNYDPTSTLTITGTNTVTHLLGITVADYSATTTHQFLYADPNGTMILSGSGNDTLVGGNGLDILSGGAGNDVLIGGAGNDILIGGAGNDDLVGGAGYDLASYVDENAGVSVDLMHGSVAGNALGDYFEGIEGVIGSAHADVLGGDRGDNVLIGGAGDDILSGYAGNDVLEGGVGADALDGGIGTDTAIYANSNLAVTIDLATHTGLGGEAEGDTLFNIENLVGSGFDDALSGDSGNNVFAGGAGADTIDGRDGSDTVDYSASVSGVTVDLLLGTGLNGDAQGDVLSNIENVTGTAWADTITGDNNANLLLGAAGDDVLVGNGGEDVLVGGAGADTLIGGAEFVTASYADSAAAVTVDLSTGTGTGGDAQGDALAAIDGVAGSVHSDTLIGNANDNALYGNAGNDLLVGGDGVDLLDGGDGFDTVSYADATAPVHIDPNANLTEGDTFLSIEAVIGSGFGDVLATGGDIHRLDGGAGDDDLTGSTLDDVLIGGAGADTFHGGGLATVDYSQSAAGVAVDLGLGIGLGGDAEGDILQSIHGLIGSAQADILIGDGNDNLFVSSAVGDIIDGAGGFDVIDYGNSDAAVTVNLASGTGTGGTAEGDIIAGIEGVFGSTHNDTLIGDASDNLFVGGAGADLIDGAGGKDTADYSASKAAVTIDLTVGTSLGGDAQGDLLIAVENVTGSAFKDTITGTSGDNVLIGLGGNDTLNDGAGGNDLLIGGVGDDVYVVGSSGTVVQEDVDSGTDTVTTALATYSLTANVEALTYTGTTTFTGYGNDLDNVFTGGIGAETFSGGDGNDKFVSSLGADIYDGGAGENIAAYTTSKAVRINLATNVNKGNDAEGDLLYNITDVSGSNFGDSIVGNDLNNTLTGRGGDDTISAGGGDDFIDGGTGNDTMYGGTGNDTFVVQDAGDVLFENTNGGIDTVMVKLTSWTLATNFENLIESDTRAFTGIGNSVDNIITSSVSNDVLYGMDGNDTLNGGAGADQLFGGNGLDTADYSTSALGVSVDLAAHTASGGDAQGDVLDSIENLTGSVFADHLTGDAGANILIGNGGGDVLDGGAGSDVLKAGSGVNTLLGGSEDDALYSTGGADSVDGGAGTDSWTGDYSASTDALTFSYNAITATGSVSNGTTLSSVEIASITTGAGDDIFLMTGRNPLVAAPAIDGGAGNDTIIYTGAWTDYIASSYGSAITLSDLRTGSPDGMVIITNVEYVQFSNGTFASADVVNVGPVAGSDTGTALVEAGWGTAGLDAASGNILDNDSDANLATLGLEETLTLSTVIAGDGSSGVPTAVTGVTQVNGTYGVLTLNPDGSYSYVLDNARSATNALDPGQTATELFSYTIVDAHGATSTAQLSIAIAGTDDRPPLVANDDSLVVTTNVLATFDGSVLVTNDSGSLDDSMRVTAISNVVGATITLIGNQLQILSTGGDASFDYTVSGIAGRTASAHVTIGTVATTTGNDSVAVALATSGAFLHGLAGNDNLVGGDGNDVFVGGAGDDIMNGGAGVDTASFADGVVAVKVNLNLTAQQVTGAGKDTFISIENVIGTGLNDTLTGNNGDNRIEGGGGNDVISGGMGNDTLFGGDGADKLDGGSGADYMDGGAGFDTYTVDNSGDVVVEALSGTAGGTDTVNSSASSLTIGANIENLVLMLGAGDINGTGNELANVITGNEGANVIDGGLGNDTINAGAGNDTLLGNDGADRLDGGTGADTMNGGVGADVYFVDNIGDVVAESVTGATGGIDIVNSSISFALTTNIENLILVAGAGDINGTGNDLANTLTGNEGANILDGGLANDILNAGAGNDMLIGGDGADKLDGGTGADSMEGGAGDDSYFVDNVGDVVIESISGTTGGSDTVNSAISYTLTANVEKLVLLGNANIDGTGNELQNVLTGNNGNNILSGGGGKDVINGGAGNDTIYGGMGSDILTGGTGNDTFVFDTLQSSPYKKTLQDFAPGQDKIAITQTVFTAFSADPLGTLSASEFFVGTTATTVDHHIIYNNVTGGLFYDADGSDAGAAVQIAVLNGLPLLSASDILIV